VVDRRWNALTKHEDVLNAVGVLLNEVANHTAQHSRIKRPSSAPRSPLLLLGVPNVFTCDAQQCLRTAFSIFVRTSDPVQDDVVQVSVDLGRAALSLPLWHEVLYCTPTTTAEDLELLVRRCFKHPARTYCISHAHRLRPRMQQALVQLIARPSGEQAIDVENVIDGIPRDYHLVVVVGDANSSLMSSLRPFERNFGHAELLSDQMMRSLLTRYLSTTLPGASLRFSIQREQAWERP